MFLGPGQVFRDGDIAVEKATDNELKILLQLVQDLLLVNGFTLAILLYSLLNPIWKIMKDILYQSLRISDEAITQEVGGETVILDMKGEKYFGLDAVGTRIWQLIQEKDNLNSAVSIMLNEFDVEESVLKDDIRDLVSRLMEEGLVNLDEEAR